MWGLYCENRLLRSAAADDDVEEQKGKEDGTDSGRIMFWMVHTVLGLVLPLSTYLLYPAWTEWGIQTSCYHL